MQNKRMQKVFGLSIILFLMFLQSEGCQYFGTCLFCFHDTVIAGLQSSVTITHFGSMMSEGSIQSILSSPHIDILHLIKGRKRNSRFFCCQCLDNPEVLFLCSRCRVTQYCSRICQKRHFTVHKEGCQMIHNMQNTSADESQQLYKLGDLVFRIAFRSCDTVDRGAFMYEKALDYYVQHMMGLENEANENFPKQNVEAIKSHCSSIYDRIRFMLVALNHPEEFLASISATSILDDLCSPDTAHNSTLQLAIGLLKMKLISDLRSGNNGCSQFSFGSIIRASPVDTQGLPDDVVTTDYSKNVLAEQENQLLRHVNAEPKLWSAVLDRSGNLSEYTCPDLFAPHPPEGTLRELYCFVQDCFFLDQGISLVLNILPDFEDYQEYCDEER